MEVKSKQEILLNFSDEFKKSEAMLNPIVVYALEVLRQGEDIYTVLELVMKNFAKKEKEQFDIMKQLIEHLPVSAVITTKIQ